VERRPGKNVNPLGVTDDNSRDLGINGKDKGEQGGCLGCLERFSRKKEKLHAFQFTVDE